MLQVEQSWVKTDEIYCFDKAIAFIQKALAKTNCKSPELLVKALHYFTLKSQLIEDFEKELDIAKFKISEVAAKRMITSAEKITGQKMKITQLTREKEEIQNKYDALKLKCIDMEKTEEKRTEEIAGLNDKLDNTEKRYKSLHAEYQSVGEYIEDQKNTESYLAKNPFGKVKIPKVRRFH